MKETKIRIEKPLSAFQYYLKEWKNLTDEEKKPFIELAAKDKKRYDAELLDIQLEKEEKIKEKQIYLRAYTGGYSAVGLDNGCKSYVSVGPVVNIIYYTEEEAKKWGVKEKAYEYYDNTVYNTKSTLYHNEKYYTYTQYGKPSAKGRNVYTYGKSYNWRNDNNYSPNPKKFTVNKNVTSSGTIHQHYTSFSEETWQTSS